MSLRILAFLLVTVLARSTKAALPGRTLHQAPPCMRACDAARSADPNKLQAVINEGHYLCNCRCSGMGNGCTLILLSVHTRCQHCIRHLISPPANCYRNSTDYNGNTAMHIAARYCRLAVVDFLIGIGFPVDSRNSVGMTPLCIASRQNDPNCGHIVRSLIRAGARPCFTCFDGRTSCEGCVDLYGKRHVVCQALRQDGACNCP